MAQCTSTILYLSRFYVPASAAAGIRADRFVKALLNKGLRVIVATVGERPEVTETVDNLIVCCITEDGQVPVGISGAEINDWPRFTPLPVPDADLVCSKTVYRVGQWLIKRYKADMIFTTGSPFGWIAVGCRLAEKYQLSLVAEFRDCWYTGMPWPYGSSGQKRRAQEAERFCMAQAEKIITETDTQKKILDQAYPDFAGKTVTIRHSYDPSITPATGELPAGQINFGPGEKRIFTMAYTGQLRGLDVVDQSGIRRVLRGGNHLLRKMFLGASFCEELRLDWMSPHYLMEALALLIKENPAWGEVIELIFVGQQLPKIDRWAQQLGLADQVRQRGPLGPEEAQQIIQKADLLILNLYGINNLDYHWCVPGKTYTYLGSGKPILALLPAGEACDLVTRAGTGFVVQPDDRAAIAGQLEKLIRQHLQGGIKIYPDFEFIRQFALPVQQKQFTDLITSVVNHPEQTKKEPSIIEEKGGQEPFLCVASPES